MRLIEDYRIIVGIMDYRSGNVFVTVPSDGAEGEIKRDMGLVLNQRIREGYELQGGVTFVAGDMYAQAIVKWADIEP